MSDKLSNFTEQLDWDSEFFGRKIAKIVLCNSDERYVEEKLAAYRSLDFDLVYIYLTAPTILSRSLCVSYNCKLVDCKMIYGIRVGEKCETSPSVVEYKGDPSQLYKLAFQSGVQSRYRTDTAFKEDDFKRLYRTWVDNSVEHLIADKVFVFNGEEDISGFVTVRIHADDSSIGLIATDSQQRGRGIGSALVSAVKMYVKDVQAVNLTVATQKENTLACSFYEKNGFSLQSETNIYHAWLKK